MIALFTHRDCLKHDPGLGHPESPERLSAALHALEALTSTQLAWYDAPLAASTDLLRAHSPQHVARIERLIPLAGQWNLDADTLLSPSSLIAARRAAGAACAAVDAVSQGTAAAAFCAVRPPGHHAERNHALGFCLFNSLAVAGLRARSRHGLARLAIVDFDVHHGNGAQNIFWHDPDALVVSVHQDRLYPHTGDADETGAYGNVLNVPLAAGAGSEPFRAAMTGPVAAAVKRFRPDILLVAAGFDGHHDDPLGGLDLTTQDYSWTGRFLTQLATAVCGGRLVASLEGGYHLDALAASVAAFVEALIPPEAE